jgi:hypothetical protein
MTLLSKDEIQRLTQTSQGPCVSIFMPTLRTGDTQQNPIRFKNLLRSAEERLAGWGLGNGDFDSFLDPARRLIGDRSFWEYQEEGLALFRSSDVFKTYRLPLSLRELSVVENRFHLKPLFPLLSDEGHFYILALSLKSIRLILASRYEAKEVDLGEIPKSFEEAMGDLTRRFSKLQPGAASARSVSRSPIFPGHGAREDDLKAEIVKYFQIVDDGLMHLAINLDRNAPFVLAGVEHLLPRYREASKLPNILDEGLTGNADGLSAEELREKAWEIVEPFFLADRRKAVDRFKELRGTGLAGTELEEILPAACDGRVDTLFTARGVRVWGSYDPEERALRFQEDQEQQMNGNEDLLDRAAVETFLRSGTIYAVEQQEVPEGRAVAAVYRY